MTDNHDDELIPETEPSGSLDPPRRTPPTAIGAGTPQEDEPPRRPGELDDRARTRSRARSRLPLPFRVADAVLRGVLTAVDRGRRAVRR